MDDRYVDEFLKQDANLKSTFVVLPKGCMISVEKFCTCKKEVKVAKNNKDKAFKIMEVVGETAGLLATPFIYLGRVTIDSLLLVTLGTSLNLTGQALKKFIDKVKERVKEIVDKKKINNPVENVVYNQVELAGVGKIR